MFIKVLLFQNPGMFKGVMQKVNPFRSASQVGTASSVRDSGVSTTNVGQLFSSRSQKASLPNP